MKKSALLGVVLTLLMLSSTLIYFISSFLFQPTLPTGNIVEYELDLQQKNLAWMRGKVLVEFFYSKGCENCREKIFILESLANQYADKIFLEKILSNESIPKLHFIGFNITENRIYPHEKFLEGENITEGNVMDVLCEVMLYPPVECAKV